MSTVLLEQTSLILQYVEIFKKKLVFPPFLTFFPCTFKVISQRFDLLTVHLRLSSNGLV